MANIDDQFKNLNDERIKEYVYLFTYFDKDADGLLTFEEYQNFLEVLIIKDNPKIQAFLKEKYRTKSIVDLAKEINKEEISLCDFLEWIGEKFRYEDYSNIQQFKEVLKLCINEIFAGEDFSTKKLIEMLKEKEDSDEVKITVENLKRYNMLKYDNIEEFIKNVIEF